MTFQELDWYIYPLLITAGVLAGFINTLTGSGSVVALAALIFAGLPAPVANGTNRLGVLVQTSVSMATFYRGRGGHLQVPHSGWYVWPAVIGAMAGAFVATDLDQELMERVIGWVMVVMLFVILYKPSRWLRTESEAAQNKSLLNMVAFFAIGFYGGFIQAGIGIFLLVGLVLMAKFNTQESNILKVSIVLLLTVPSIFIFLYFGQVNWLMGGIMAIGQSAGAWLATRFALTNSKAALWTHRLLVGVVILSIVQLFGIGQWLLSLL